jgi:hypothetical protein
MTEDELQALLEKSLAERDRYDLFVEECQDQDIRLRFSLKSGETWSSAALLSLVDTALRAAAGVVSSLSHLNVTVLRAPHDADVIALSRVIRRDGPVRVFRLVGPLDPGPRAPVSTVDIPPSPRSGSTACRRNSAIGSSAAAPQAEARVVGVGAG